MIISPTRTTIAIKIIIVITTPTIAPSLIPKCKREIYYTTIVMTYH